MWSRAIHSRAKGASAVCNHGRVVEAECMRLQDGHTRTVQTQGHALWRVSIARTRACARVRKILPLNDQTRLADCHPSSSRFAVLTLPLLTCLYPLICLRSPADSHRRHLPFAPRGRCQGHGGRKQCTISSQEPPHSRLWVRHS